MARSEQQHGNRRHRVVAHMSRRKKLLTREELIEALRNHIRLHDVTQTAASRRWGCSDAFVSAVLRQRKEPNEKMLSELGYRRMVVYARVDSDEITPPVAAD